MYDATLQFHGHTIRVSQRPRDRGDDGSDNTGWCVWEVRTCCDTAVTALPLALLLVKINCCA